MMKFKVGDKVRIINYWSGAIGEITFIRNFSSIHVEVPYVLGIGENPIGSFAESDLRHLTKLEKALA